MAAGKRGARTKKAAKKSAKKSSKKKGQIPLRVLEHRYEELGKTLRRRGSKKV